MTAAQSKNYEYVNGLGTITFSGDLIAQTIKQVLEAYPKYKYESHSIATIADNYLEVTLVIKTPAKFSLKIIDRLQKDLLLVLKESLSLTCVLAININHGK